MNVQRLIEVAKGERHANYTHVVEKAKLYRALVTGKVDHLLQQIVRREDTELFEQRKRITKHITKAVCSNLIDPAYKVPRARYSVVLSSPDIAPDKMEVLRDRRATYYGTKSLDTWMKTRFIKLNAVDPNAFHVIEFDPFDANKENARPYPFEVPSEKALDYVYKNNLLEYLIVQGAVKFTEGGKTVTGEKYTLYGKDETVIMSQIAPQDAPQGVHEDGVAQMADDGTGYVRLKKKAFRIDFPLPHNANQVPAIRVGSFLDTETDDATAVSIIDRVTELLEKSIKINSELDLTMALMAHPFIVRWVEPCDAPQCINGTLADGSNCHTCGGTGKKKIPTTVAETMEFVIPKRMGESTLPDLSNMITFKTPPIEIAEFQQKYIDGLVDRCKRVMFSTDMFTKTEVAQTATGANIDLQNVYDFLSVIAEQYTAVWEFCINMIGKFIGIEKGLVASLTFPKDFKLKGYDELIADLKSAEDVGTPEIRRQINQDIVQILYADDEYAMAKYRTKDMFNPFSGMTQLEIMTILGSDIVRRRDKVFYANMGQIFDELEEQYATTEGGFYQMTRTKQKELIDAKVGELLAVLDNERPALTI